jgi:alkylhydroperoxidase family enzyme
MTTVSEHGTLPLDPIESPHGLFLRMVYAMSRRRYGKTPTAFRVLYARNPWIALVSSVIILVTSIGLRIGSELRFLVSIAYATRGGCTFCRDLLLAEAAKARIGAERFRSLLDFEESSAFTEREKAALAYVAAVHESLSIDDAIFARMRRSFDEREIVEIVFACAVERYFNSMALPLRIGSDCLAS